MAIAISKLTAQGQISIPAEVRRRLGIGPGSLLEWGEEGSNVIVRRVGLFSSEEVHQALFGTPPVVHTLQELKDGLREAIKRRHARG